MIDPHKDLVEAVARISRRYYARMWGSSATYAVSDGEIDWSSEPVRCGLTESQARDIANDMNARAIIALIAERTKDATPEMVASHTHTTPDYLVKELWSSMHRASPLWPKEKA